LVLTIFKAYFIKGFKSLSKTPFVSVRNITFLAFSAIDTLLATKSALILNPGWSIFALEAIGAITG